MASNQNLLSVFNKIFGPKHPLPMSWNRVQNWCIFLVSAMVMVVLCFKGGHLGGIGSQSLIIPRPFGMGGQWVLPAGGFMLLWAGTFIASSLLFFTLPRGLSPLTLAMLILLLGITCRFVLLAHPPSNDIYRYLWEGRLVTEGINPYHYAPSDPLLADLAASDPLHAKINHPNFTAIYPPFFQYVMALFVWVDNTVRGLKFVIMWMDVATLLLIIKLLQQRGQDFRWAALYAFNPVILYAFAAQGHLDVFQNFFLIAAICLYDSRRWSWMFVALGLAIQSKYMAVFVFPLFMRRDNWAYSVLMLIVVLAPFIPLVDGHPERFFTSLITFSQQFALNGSVHELLRIALGGILPATRICQLFFGIALLWALVALHPQRSVQVKDDPLPGCFFIFSALILLSPTVHYWYLSWALVFLPFRPHVAWVALTLTTGAYFAVFGNQQLIGQFRLPGGYQLFIWTIPWIFFCFSMLRFPNHFRNAGTHRSVKTMTVVIPTLNESKLIHPCVSRLNHHPAVMEVIVVDGGSKDHTISDAKRAGAKVIVSDSVSGTWNGRGGQIAEGVAAAKGDVIAIVHADTMMDVSFCSKILNLLNRHPMVIGGALGSVFDAKGLGYRLLELANDVRAAALGISFGDQIQFFRRKPVVSAELYPNQPLMEDVELSLRLKRIGRLFYFFSSSKVSARKWQKFGVGHAGSVLWLVSLYLWQRFLQRSDPAAMYRQYYKK